MWMYQPWGYAFWIGDIPFGVIKRGCLEHVPQNGSLVRWEHDRTRCGVFQHFQLAMFDYPTARRLVISQDLMIPPVSPHRF